jgi:sulfite reductase (ferredoxin)
VRLDAFVRWNQVSDVIRGVAELFRSASTLREHRERARLKFLFLREGWTGEEFQSELERVLGFALDPAEPELPPHDIYRDHIGIHPQKQEGLCFVGAAVLRGRVSWEQLQAAAELSERFASGDLRTTVMQNLLVVNVPHQNAEPLAKELTAIGFPVHASPFVRGAIACSGTEFCKLAITETKGFSRWLTEELDDRLPGFDQELKLHVTGCPNSCGQHWIADIGLEGKKLKVNGALVDAYYFCLGGAVGATQAIARPVGYRCSAQEVPDAIERLLRTYRATREPGENLRRFFARHSNDNFWPDSRSSPWNGTSPPLRRLTRWRADGNEHRISVSDVPQTGGTQLPGPGSGQCRGAENSKPARLRRASARSRSLRLGSGEGVGGWRGVDVAPAALRVGRS